MRFSWKTSDMASQSLSQHYQSGTFYPIFFNEQNPVGITLALLYNLDQVPEPFHLK